MNYSFKICVYARDIVTKCVKEHAKVYMKYLTWNNPVHVILVTKSVQDGCLLNSLSAVLSGSGVYEVVSISFLVFSFSIALLASSYLFQASIDFLTSKF